MRAQQIPTIRKTIKIIIEGTTTAITTTTVVIEESVFSAIVLMVSVTYCVILEITSLSELLYPTHCLSIQPLI